MSVVLVAIPVGVTSGTVKVIARQTGQPLVGVTGESWNDSHWASYLIAATFEGTSPTVTASVPDNADTVEARLIVNNNPTDPILNQGRVSEFSADAAQININSNVDAILSAVGDIGQGVNDNQASLEALEAVDVAAIIAQAHKIIVLSPIDGSEMTLVKGDKYDVTQGTQITLAKQAGEPGWPTTVSTIHFSAAPDDQLIRENNNATSTGVDDKALTSVTNSGGVLSIDTAGSGISFVETAKSGRYDFWFVANKATAPKTIRAGKLKVMRGDTN
jgi:hypothetical protein